VKQPLTLTLSRREREKSGDVQIPLVFEIRKR